MEGIEIECETEVKLFGVTLDFKLNFNEHISNICKKKIASRQLRERPFNLKGGGGGWGVGMVFF